MARKYGRYFYIDPATKLGYARVQVPTGDFDATGKPKYKSIKRRAKNATHAEQIAREILDEYERRGRAFVEGREMTFPQLCDWYARNYVIEPIYQDGKKVAGQRTWKAERNKLARLAAEFGDVRIADLDDLTLRRFKLRRLRAGIKSASINRDFETIRAMLRRAGRMKWLRDLPDFGDLIDKSLEERRTVTITDEQERLILDAARSIARSPRLPALIVALRDTGARPNELYPVSDYGADYSGSGTFFEPLRWRDVFDAAGKIKDLTRLVSYKGTVRDERLCVITERLKAELLDLWRYLLEHDETIVAEHQARPDNLIWPARSYKRAWSRVRELAGLPGLRLRDLRRDWSTRLARLGFSDRLAQRGMGHKRLQQTFDYTEFDEAAAMLAKKMLDDVIEIEGEV